MGGTQGCVRVSGIVTTDDQDDTCPDCEGDGFDVMGFDCIRCFGDGFLEDLSDE